jgi:uncharacterized protein (TIGR00297 family)
LDLERLLIAVGVNLVVALTAFFAGAVGRSGVVAGLVVGSLIYYAVGLPGYSVLLLFFVLGSALSKLGYSRKAALGVAQEAGGRRGAKHAAANCGTGALLAIAVLIVGPGHPAVPALLAAYLGAFATALADTTGSEIGQLYGKTPILITTFKRVPVGTDGAVSLEGTLAGILASALIGLLGFWLIGPAFGLLGVAAVVLGAFVGTTAESYLGATIEGLEHVDNEVINFANTVIGAAATAGFFLLFT